MVDKGIDEMEFAGVLLDYPYSPLMKFIGEELYIISVVNEDNTGLFATLQSGIFNERFTSLKIAVKDFTKDIATNPDKLDSFYRLISRIFAFPGYEHELESCIQGVMVVNTNLPTQLTGTIPDSGDNKIEKLLFFMSVNSSILEYYINKKAKLSKGIR